MPNALLKRFRTPNMENQLVRQLENFESGIIIQRFYEEHDVMASASAASVARCGWNVSSAEGGFCLMRQKKLQKAVPVGGGMRSGDKPSVPSKCG